LQRTAWLIDGAFLLHRWSRRFPDVDSADPLAAAEAIGRIAAPEAPTSPQRHYRTFFYDCPPFAKKMHRPVSEVAVDFAKTPQAQFRNALHDALIRQRSLALRLGRLSDHAQWTLKPDSLRRLQRGDCRFDQLTDSDYELDIRQKAVDMRIGLDVAALAYKRLVDQIVLVAGDADFVPVAKLARREGLDVLLDPLGKNVPRDLIEHVDGVIDLPSRPNSEIEHGP
jgi:uncharacterized LabA/DUF88 family protein